MQEELKAHIENIIPINEYDFNFVYSLFTTKQLNKGQYLIKEGSLVKDAYFIIKGLLKLIYIDNSGKEYIISFAMENWWESDFQAYFNKSKAKMSLQCLENTTVLCISLENYQKMCDEVPKMQIFLIKLSNSGFAASQQRILSLLTSNAKEKYEQLQTQYPTLLQRIPKSQLALYLGVSRETLSRLYS